MILSEGMLRLLLVNTLQLIYLISVANEEPLLARRDLHRNNDGMTWIHHRIT